MNVALEVTSISDKNSVRGVGTYTQNLIDALKLKKGKVSVSTFKGASNLKVDLVHYPSFDLFFHKLPIRKNMPRVVTVHDVIPLVFPKHYPVGPKGRANLLLQKIALRNSNAVITDSQASKKDISRLLGYPNDKIHVIYLAASSEFMPIKDKNELLKIKKKYKLPQDFMLYVGDVNWNKNLEGLLNAVKDTKINLVLVGKALTDETLEQVKKIDKQITELAVRSKVIKTGYVPNADLCAIYNLAKATVVPSFYEGFGLTVLESMSSGTPVICANNSSLSEIAGNAAILFDANNPNALSDTINKFLNLTEKETNDIASSSVAHSKKYSWDKVANETIGVYKKVLNS